MLRGDAGRERIRLPRNHALAAAVAMLLNLAGWAFMLLALFKADGAGRAPEMAQPGGAYQAPFPGQPPAGY